MKNVKIPKVIKYSIYIAALFLAIIITQQSENKKLTYDMFLENLEAGNVERVILKENNITVFCYETEEGQNTFTVTYFEDPELVNRLIEHEVIFAKKTSLWEPILTGLLYILPLFMCIYFCKKISSSMSGSVLSSSKAKIYTPTEHSIKFADVAGEDEAKDSLEEIVDFLHNPEKYSHIGAKLPKGALLVGPPGTGKTLLAKAVAGEAGVPFYSLTGSDFVQMFVGMGAARVRDLFTEAKEHAPCIIFIDEIDAIGRKRDARNSNDERENTLNQLLSEMDGFDASKGIIVLGATNRPEILDAALLRPGRFDRQIIVGKPDYQGRKAILDVHAKNVKLSSNVDFSELAWATTGASGADLANIINEAAILAVRAKRECISQSDLMTAVEVVLVGKEKKDRVLSEKEKEIVAYHEIGHALVAAVQKNTEPIQKITIIPRTMGALGFVMQTPEKEKFLSSKIELEEQLVTTLAGRASEEIFFNSITTGASNDIETATQIAKSMVTQYGMSEVGLVAFAVNENSYLSNVATLNCSPGIAEKVDNEVIKLINKAYEDAKLIINEHKNEMKNLATFLIENETINGKQFMELLNKEKELV